MSQDPTKIIGSNEFNSLWKRMVTILVYFGYSEDNLEQLRATENMERIDFGTTKVMNLDNLQEAVRLKEVGNKEFKIGNLDTALQRYTEAIAIADIPDQDLATLYCNIAAVYLERSINMKPTASDQSSAMEKALENAEHAVNLRPNWWKAHFRVGKVLEIMGELKKAKFAFDCAVVLNTEDERVKKARDQCQLKLSESEIRADSSRARFDPFGKIVEEGCSDAYMKMCREFVSLLEKDDPETDVLQDAHRFKYEIDGNLNYEEIANLYEEDTRNGNAESMFNLGMLTKEGIGVKKDMKRAVLWLEQAAAQPSILNGRPNFGVAEAEYEIGLLHMEGQSLTLNLEVAFSYLQQSSEHGNGFAAHLLGKMCITGVGVKRDVKCGIEYWKLAASRGIILAMESLYDYFLEEENPQQAKKWFRDALENDCVRAKESSEIFEEKLGKIPTKQVISDILPLT